MTIAPTFIAEPAEADAGQRNMRLLVQLRWLAVGGQLLTIGIVQWFLGIPLPLWPLLGAILILAMVNAASRYFLAHRPVPNVELTAALLFDVAALAWQLNFTGGIANPFASLFLLQVVLGAMLLRPPWSFAIAAAALLALILIAIDPVPLALPEGEDPMRLYLIGSLVSFTLIAVLVVSFITRISGNLSTRDAALAAIRQRAAEEDHIVRMGLLASGAAHELGTPLSTLSVILGDWKRMPLSQDVLEDVSEMETAVARCKAIVSGILMSAGEARGEQPKVTTMRNLLTGLVAEWQSMRLPGVVRFTDNFGPDLPIVSDPALRQVLGNIIDNAVNFSPEWVGITASRQGPNLLLEIEDKGPGFSEEILAAFGQPYRSTSGRPGGGLGLFLLVNVVRKLGGEAHAENRDAGGARVSVTIPLSALAYQPKDAA